MKYTIVSRETANGASYRIRNQDGLYAGGERPNLTHYIRSWDKGSGAWNYVENHLADDRRLVWVQDPNDIPYVGGKPGAPSMSHQPAARSYKPAHGGYPEPEGTAKPRCVGQELDRMAAGWAFMSTVTGRIPGSQPLVWPVLPQVDDGSNEEASTVPVQAMQDAELEEMYYSLRKLAMALDIVFIKTTRYKDF